MTPVVKVLKPALCSLSVDLEQLTQVSDIALAEQKFYLIVVCLEHK